MRNRCYISIFALLLLGCGQKKPPLKSEGIIKLGKLYFTEKQIADSVLRLEKPPKPIKKAYDLVDSVMKYNANNGFVFYEKGSVEGQDLHFEKAICDFKIAKELHYDSGKCQTMINLSEFMIKDGIK